MPAPVLLGERALFASQRFRLVEERWGTPDGEVVRAVIHHPGAVALLAQPDPDHLLLVRQFRYPIRRWTLEVPAGTRQAGEAPETTAARELEEETGWRCGRLHELLRCQVAVGISDEELILYRAEGLHPGQARPDPGELVGPVVVPLRGLPALRAAGEILDAKTLFALALLGQGLTVARS
jgi:8-oxo-dGTP pyrophosphatase MutT (NUDIX family)